MTIDCDRDRSDSSEADLHLSWSRTFDVLSHRYRRDVLRFVAEADDGTATVGELGAHLVERAAERTDEPPRCDRIMNVLHHVHLPKLADADVVDYDARSQVVKYRQCDRLMDVLECVRIEDTGREITR